MNIRFKIILSCFYFIIVCFTNIFSQHWQSDFPVLNSQIRCIYSDTLTNKLYVGGAIPSLGTPPPYGLMEYNGVKWDTLPNSGISPIYAITRYNSDIVLGGSLGIKKWNGSTFDTLGKGVNGAVFSLFVLNNELYVGGVFDTAGNIPVNSLAKWDGNTWSNVFSFPNNNTIGNYNYVNSIALYNNDLIVAGNFEFPLNEIAKWDGTNWISLGGGFYGSLAGVEKVLEYKNNLYVAGTFSKTENPNNPGNYIAKWDGINWSDVGGGVIGIGGGNGQVHDLIIYNDELYAGGVFSYAGGVPAQYIAKWDGTQWCGLGSYFDNRIYGLAVYQDMLYIGGGFWTIDGDSINSIAKWTGGSYVDTCGIITSINQINDKENNITVYPNPATENITLEIPEGESGQYSLQFLDVTGRLIKEEKNISDKTYFLNVYSLKKGVYFVKLIGSKYLYLEKMIIQ